MKNKKAFTLVELLAVIVILAVILVIAVPQVLDVIDTTKVGSLESSAKLIANSAEKKYAEFLALGKDTSTIKCSDVTKLNDRDYGTCTISFDENGKATVSIKGKENGKFEGLKCEGTKDNMVCGDIPQLPVINCTFTPSEEDLVETKLYTIKDYDACMTYLKSTVPEDELTDEMLNQADSICKGNGIPEAEITTSEFFEQAISNGLTTEEELINLDVIKIEIEKRLRPGVEYVNGQYTYRYKQESDGNSEDSWVEITEDGWGVVLTDKKSTEPITSNLCTYINNKPIVSMRGMFAGSNATVVDLSSFNTSKVTDMSYMFYYTRIVTELYNEKLNYNSNGFSLIYTDNLMKNYNVSPLTWAPPSENYGLLDLSSFDTSKVTDMNYMFFAYTGTNIDLSSFNTNNVVDMSGMFEYSAATSLDLSNFNTSNVTNMSCMFQSSEATSLDLSSFDTSNVTSMSSMFAYSKATSIDLSSFNTSNVTNMESMFSNSKATSLNLSNFDTSNVTSMDSMFSESKATSIDLSSFDTSNVTNMSYMFSGSAATSLDLSSFDTSNVTDMNWMFSRSSATTGYARTLADADKFNSSSNKPSTLTFVVKGS